VYTLELTPHAIMDIGEISVINYAAKGVGVTRVIGHMEPAHHVILDIREVSVTDDAATGGWTRFC